MKRSLFLISFLFIFVLNGTAQNWIWGNGSSGPSSAEGWDVATDHSGNVYVVGTFCGDSLTFGNLVLHNPYATTCDIYIAKYDVNGYFIWAKREGGSNTEIAFSITTDKHDNIYFTGTFTSDTLVYGNDTLFNSGIQNVFLMKMDPLGNELWARSSVGSGHAICNSVSTDTSTSDVAITGYYTAPASFGSYSLSSPTGSDVFVTRYTSSGNVLWAKNSGTSSGRGQGIAFDRSSNIFATGYFSGSSMSFGTVTFNNPIINQNYFLLKLDASGNALWGRNAASTIDAVSNDVATDETGDAYITGHYDSTITIGSNTFFTTSTSATDESLIVKYDAAGNYVWAKSSECPSTNMINTGYSIATDLAGNVFVSGGFMGAPKISFDQDTFHQGSFMDPMYLLVLDKNGQIICASSLESGSDDNNGVTVNANDDIYVGGDDFGSPFIVGPDTLFAPGGENSFVAKYQCDLSGIPVSNQIPGIKIYPNPSSGIFNLDFNETNFKNGKIEIFDVLGKTVFQSKITNPQSAIDLSGNADGIYFYRVTNGNDIVASGKLIIQ